MKLISFRGDHVKGQFLGKTAGVQRRVNLDPGDLDHPLGDFWFTRRHADPAVEAAKRAFPKWRDLGERRRAGYLASFYRTVSSRREELARLITRQMGKPLWESESEVSRFLDRIQLTRTDAPKFLQAYTVKMEGALRGRCRYKPRGVMAVLGPFNFPAHLPGGQILPALLLGNTVVFKPSELTPLVGQFIAECWKAVGLPPGVFNLIQGDGTVGKEIILHPDVKGILFTGSRATGLAIQELLARQPEKLVALEMGGKNAAIVLADAPLDLAVRECLIGAFSMAGQRCNATSRILLHRKIAEPFLDRFCKGVDTIRVGYGLDENVFMGPLVSEAAMKRYLTRLQEASGEGVEMVRSPRPLWTSRKGFYVSPSVGLVRGPSRVFSSYIKGELFGPNVAVLLIDSLEEAIALNNATPYGLVVSIFTKDRRKFEKAFQGCENGLVHWNVSTIRSSARLPFGGVKGSGNDRPAGYFAPYFCTVPVASLEARGSAFSPKKLPGISL